MRWWWWWASPRLIITSTGGSASGWAGIWVLLSPVLTFFFFFFIFLKKFTWKGEPTNQGTTTGDGWLYLYPPWRQSNRMARHGRPGRWCACRDNGKKKPLVITHVQKAKGKKKKKKKWKEEGAMLCHTFVVLLLLPVQSTRRIYIYVIIIIDFRSPAGRCATVVSSLFFFSFLFFSPRQSRLPCVVVVVVGTARPLSLSVCL